MPLTLTSPIYLLIWLLIPLLLLSVRSVNLGEKSRMNRMLILGLRSMIIIVLGLALSNPRMVKGSDRVNLMFMLDVSESVAPQTRAKAEEFMRRAAMGMKGTDRAGLIVFGQTASIEIGISDEFEPGPISSTVKKNFTDISSALELAVGRMPRQGQNRIVLISDGNQNLGDAAEAANLAQSLGVQVFPIPTDSWFTSSEIFLEKLITPEKVPLHTPFEVRLVIVSSGEAESRMVLTRNNVLMASQTVTLSPGKNIFNFKDTLEQQGLYLYKAVLNAREDTVFQNNEGLSFTQGKSRLKVLYVGDDENSHLARALTAQGIELETKKISQLPRFLHGLLDYSAIVLDNASGIGLTYSIMENLEKYVKDIGGGLVMIGGDKSFGAGGYLGTSVEKALPVFMDVPTTLEMPGFVLILLIDKSSSMAGSIKSKNKLEGAKIAAFSAVEMLNPNDRVGILAFDSAYSWVVRPIRADRRRIIARRLASLAEGGGTDLYPGLKEAFQALKRTKAAKKHIIILSDGLTEKADFKSLVEEMREAKVTISTVAVGNDSDRVLLKQIAIWGGGRSYYTVNAENIPRIFVGETRIASKKVIIEKNMAAIATMEDEMTAGIPLDNLPPVLGQVITFPKPTARILMETEEGPLLAAWQYGLGRSAAFTSDLSTRWGRHWVAWDSFPKFAAQMVKWVSAKETNRRYRKTITRKSGQAFFSVDVADEKDRFINNLDLQLKVIFPSKADVTIALDQTAPGRYSGKFNAREIGPYYLNLFSSEKNDKARPEIYGYSIPYTDEFTTIRPNMKLLKKLASITQGRILNPEEDPSHLFKADKKTTEYGRKLWPYLTLAVLLLLILDVAARKLDSLEYFKR